jgi:hypothetical protein
VLVEILLALAVMAAAVREVLVTVTALLIIEEQTDQQILVAVEVEVQVMEILLKQEDRE